MLKHHITLKVSFDYASPDTTAIAWKRAVEHITKLLCHLANLKVEAC